MARFKFFISIVLFVLLFGCGSLQKENVKVPHESLLDSLFDPSLKPFYYGVASGDPTYNSVVVWTKVEPDYKDEEIRVYYEMSKDSLFETHIVTGLAYALPENDHTINITIPDLKDGQTYYYRFQAKDKYSIVGRTRTVPKNPTGVSLAFVSCSNLEGGVFNAYESIAKNEEIFAVLHLGDYFYEYPAGKYGGEHLKNRHLPEHELVSLEDYRLRYAQYRLDPQLREAHQKHPFICVWDDHESANNANMHSAQNHQDEEGNWKKRKEASIKAYFEWIPVRENDDYILYRSFDYGHLFKLIMLDTRLAGRDEQVYKYDEDKLYGKNRSLLGRDQYKWLVQNLNTDAVWKVVGNQIIISNLYTNADKSYDEHMADKWDGYPAEKSRLMNYIKRHHVNNIVFLTGDAHVSFAMEVKDDKNTDTTYHHDYLGTEFVTPSISAGNIGRNLTPDSLKTLENHFMSLNPHIKWCDLKHHGYVQVDISYEAMEAKWIFMDQVDSTNYKDFVGYAFKLPVK